MESITSNAYLCSFAKGFGNMFYIVNPSELDIGDHEFEKVPKFIQRAVPYFLLFIIVEELYGRYRGKTIYAIRDTVCSISLGIVQQVLGLWINSIGLVPYIWIYKNFRIIDHFPRGLLLFITTLLFCDLMYYVFHRVAHNWHLLWAAHSVHHSGERYNFATALRQGAFQPWTSWVFYLPLALLGIPPAIFSCHSQLNTVYQFWIHTEIVDRLPWPLEGFLNTPSHHRMHHQPPGNCNYAGVFIIWDRLLNTFKDEAETKVLGVYGLAKPADTFDPFVLNILHVSRLLGIDSIPSRFSWSNVKLIFSRRCDHSWVPDISGMILGAFRLYSMKQERRVDIPIRDDCLDSEIRSKLNSREIEFFRGRNDREGKSFFSSNFIIAILSIFWFLFTFISGYAMMDNIKGIQDLLCSKFESKLAVVCSNPSNEWLQCNWITLCLLCVVLISMLSTFALIQHRLDKSA